MIAKINRQDFGVSWQDTMDRGGIVVGNEIDITIDVEYLKMVDANSRRT
jgi:polyisoprenoid-binding protein YceI